MIVDFVRDICNLVGVDYLEYLEFFSFRIKTDSVILILEMVVCGMLVIALWQFLKYKLFRKGGK